MFLPKAGFSALFVSPVGGGELTAPKSASRQFIDSPLSFSLRDQGFGVGVGVGDGVRECCCSADVSVMQSAFPVKDSETGLQRAGKAKGGAAKETRCHFIAPEAGTKRPLGGVCDMLSHVP